MTVAWAAGGPLDGLDPRTGKVVRSFKTKHSVVSGCCLVIFRRLKGGKEVGNSSYLDWNLILLILTVTSLGILTEVLRLAEAASAAYIVYFIHLVFVFYAIAYFPFSKLAHLLYRSLAVLYADYRERPAPAAEAAS